MLTGVAGTGVWRLGGSAAGAGFAAAGAGLGAGSPKTSVLRASDFDARRRRSGGRGCSCCGRRGSGSRLGGGGRGSRGGPFAREDRLPDLVDHLLRIERLIHEVVRAGVFPLGRVVRRVAAREEEDGRAGLLLPDLLGEGVAVVSAERRVDHDGVWLFAELPERSLARVRGDDVEVLPAEGDLEHFAHRCAVIDGEEGLGHVGVSRMGGGGGALPRLRLCGVVL